MVRVDVQQAPADSSGDRAPAVVLDGVAVLEAASKSAWFDLKLVALAGGPAVEDGVEDSTADSWRGEVCQLGQMFGGFVGLPCGGVLPYVG